MIKSIDLAISNSSFGAQKSKKNKNDSETRILPNTLKTRVEQSTQKTMSAFIDYPVKGLKGDINSSFYEFLTMGIVPYLLGSAMFMYVFNALNHGNVLPVQDKVAVAKKGNKLALGVVLYGVFKTLSKYLVTTPIKATTGVDTEMPYQNKVCNLPKGAGENANIDVQIQQRKIFDSKEFFRKDLLERSYYDRVAKKLGLGDDLNDSISETTPIIQNIVATSNLAKSLTSYSWAAVGVGLAMQDSWLDFFESIKDRKLYYPKENSTFATKLGKRLSNFGTNTWNISKQFLKSGKQAFVELWCGDRGTSGYMKHSGKALLGVASAITILTTANSIIRAKNMAKNFNENSIDKTKESKVI